MSDASEPAPASDLDGLGLSDEEKAVLAKVGAILRRLNYGTVVLVVQDGKVVQIEMAEKFRLAMSETLSTIVPDPAAKPNWRSATSRWSAARQAARVSTAAADVSFDVQPGEFVCLLGPSGSGKTSVLNVLAGLEAPSSGQVLLDGQPITGPGPDRAVLFQNRPCSRGSRFAERRTGSPVRGSRARGTARAHQPLARNVHLEGWADAQPHELSAGMRQRAALARALAADPDVLLGDEPFGRSTPRRANCSNEVQRVWVESEGRKTFLFVTHNVREAVVLADRVFVMSARPSRLLEEFRPDTERPRGLDDVLVSRVVSEIQGLWMSGGGRDVAREMAREGSRAALTGIAAAIAVWAAIAAATSRAAIRRPPSYGRRSSMASATGRSRPRQPRP